jgi:methylated-DNA-[protein]-cysteine S-methyltransferase
VRAELTRYAVPGWGVGELWTENDVVLAHDFDFGVRDDDLGDTASQHELVGRFTAFLAGEAVAFDDVQVDESTWTQFQRSVAMVLRGIPRGEVVSYAEVAALAGYPRAQRAVGTFCARNPYMILIPCHRVVSTSGIGTYGSAGIAVKRRLLALEGVEL